MPKTYTCFSNICNISPSCVCLKQSSLRLWSPDCWPKHDVRLHATHAQVVTLISNGQNKANLFMQGSQESTFCSQLQQFLMKMHLRLSLSMDLHAANFVAPVHSTMPIAGHPEQGLPRCGLVALQIVCISGFQALLTYHEGWVDTLGVAYQVCASTLSAAAAEHMSAHINSDGQLTDSLPALEPQITLISKLQHTPTHFMPPCLVGLAELNLNGELDTSCQVKPLSYIVWYSSSLLFIPFQKWVGAGRGGRGSSYSSPIECQVVAFCIVPCALSRYI